MLLRCLAHATACILHATACILHVTALYFACYCLYFACNCLSCACYRLGGWPFWRAGLRAQRATLPGRRWRYLGRRSWSFYVCGGMCRPWRGGASTPSGLSLGDPSRVDFHLLFYPLVTPLRRDDQGLLSDEASGFTSCVACDRHFLISNGSWGHNHAALHMQPPVLHTQPPIFCLQLPVLHLLPPWRLAFLESRVVSAASYPV